MKEWIYGRNPVYEVIVANKRHIFRLLIKKGAEEKGRLIDIINRCKKDNIPIEWVNRKVLDSIHKNHQGVALEVSKYQYHTLLDILELAEKNQEPPLILILDALKDPQNFATLLRTADAVGVHGVLLPHRQTTTVTPAVVNASSGACEHLLIAQTNLHQAIQALKTEDIWIIGLEKSSAAQSLNQIDLTGPIALVVGSEGEGLHPIVRKSCDLLLRLPMRGKIASLNAAVAGSIALYAIWESRGFPN